MTSNSETIDDSKPVLILDKLYVGSYQAAQNKQLLQSLKITHILSCLKLESPLYSENDFIQKIIPINDMETEPFYKYFDTCCEFIQEGIQKGAVLVHCLNGVSRSATAILAYMVKIQKMTLEDALKIVQSAKPNVLPNAGFLRQLKQLIPVKQKIGVRCKMCRTVIFDVSQTIEHVPGKKRKDFLYKKVWLTKVNSC
jgi:protein-tyrosine phosphatase